MREPVILLPVYLILSVAAALNWVQGQVWGLFNNLLNGPVACMFWSMGGLIMVLSIVARWPQPEA